MVAEAIVETPAPPSTDVAPPAPDDTQTPPPSEDGVVSAESQVAPTEDGKPEETSPAPVRTEAELYRSWVEKRQRIDAGDLSVSIEGAEEVAARAVNNRRIAAQQREAAIRQQREVILNTRPQLVSEVQEAIAPLFTDEDIARLKAEDIVGKHWGKVEQAAIAPYDHVLGETLAAFATGLAQPPPEAIAQYASMTPEQKLEAIVTTAFQRGMAANPDGFISKKDHEAALQALRNEHKAATTKIEAPPPAGAPSAPGGWLTTAQIDAMGTNEWLSHPLEWREAQRNHARQADAKPFRSSSR